MTVYRIQPTTRQHDFVQALQRKLALSDAALDAHCGQRFGSPYAELDRTQVSALLDELQRWEAVPAELKRAMGQMDLFEVPS